MAKQKHISTQSSQQELEDWLRQQLEGTALPGSGHPQQRVDQEDPFYKEAMEGLEKFDSTADIYKQTSAVNRSLQQKISQAGRKRPLDGSTLYWYIIAVVVILLMVVIAFVVLRMRMGQI